MAHKVLLLSVLWMAALLLANEVAANKIALSVEVPTEPSETGSTASPTTPGDSSSTTNGTQSNSSTTGTPPPPPTGTPPPPPTGTPPPSTTGNSSSTTNGTQSNSSTTPSPTTPPNPCEPNPCGDGSSCRPDSDVTFTCVCPPGEQYNGENNMCETARVYPTEFTTEEPYVEQMADRASLQFQTFSNRVVSDFKKRLTGVGQAEPEVLVLELLPVAPVSRSDGRTVKAVVQIIYPASSTVTTEAVTGALAKACTECVVKGTITVQNLCQVGACNLVSSICQPENGDFTCKCLAGYTPLDDRNRQCVVACPTGQTLEGTACVDCSFGYTGFNCEELWERDIVIVGCVLGGLLLIAIILVIVFATKKPKKSSKRGGTADVGKSFNSRPPINTQNSYGNFDSNQTGTGNRSANGFGNSEVPRIPRATTNGGWESRTNLEMTPSHSRQNLITSSRPQSNPYSQNRAQVNPYAQNQGRNNPYYM